MISVVVLTKNEEKNIADCLENLTFCNEILVIDDNSDDRTVEVAKRMKAKVFKHSLNNDFSTQLNYGLGKARCEWVFILHADERVSKELAEEIVNFTKSDFDGALIERIDYMWGKELKHGEVGGLKILRLGRKGKGKWIGKVHEKWNIVGRIGTLKNKFYHYPHPTIVEFLKEVNFATDIRSTELQEKGVKLSAHQIITNPLGKFLFNYFIRLGFLDGIQGFILAVMMSFHSFLVRGKLWQLNQEKKFK